MYKFHVHSTLYSFYLMPFFKGLVFAYHQHVFPQLILGKLQDARIPSMRSTPYSVFVFASLFRFISLTKKLIILPQQYAARVFQLARHKAHQKSGNYAHSDLKNRLCAYFLFKFKLLSHIYVCYTNMSFWEQLSGNPSSCNFVLFTIVVLTWYEFTSYSIVLPM